MRLLAPLLLAAFAATPVLAQDATTAPPAAPFAKVSELVALPDFIPGLGTLYVDPATLPAGPFLAYDHDGRLSATVYMVPLDDLSSGKSFDGLAVGAETVTGVDIYYNAGHPGVEKPHAHVVLYHDAGAHDRLAQ
ncbi:MAG TPA: hypothetical protein PKA35_03930 [Paracoccus solventivorans]|uniref:M23 family metallopeptidase n=1 Tax=Paracoccus solventivorans TaxID=53463 RepID=A0A832QWL9_9RHOB|nr:hypothetical protein [Paracoccus solventivorans]HHW32760.1 hypothetical protein [Paracoccus solventivorans]HMM08254.1 hypothetical protein [Paracoccus solventivorans]